MMSICVCGVEFEAESKDGYIKRFCSRKCANKRVHTEETKQKIKESVLTFTRDNPSPKKGQKGNKLTEEQKQQILERNRLKREATPFENLSIVRKREFVKRQANNSCEKCGWNKLHPVIGTPLIQIHHRDGNDSNWSLENLQVLCPNCHSETDSFMFYGKRHKPNIGS